MIFDALKNNWKTLLRPHEVFKKNLGEKLDVLVKNYLHLIISMGILAAIITFIWNTVRAFYYDWFLDVQVNYVRMFNYLGAKVFGVFLGYLLIGTFGLFFVSIIINFFFKMKYVDILRILFIATAPIFFFGWFPGAVIGTVIWSVFLFFLGQKILPKTKVKTNRQSLRQRD